MGEIEAQALRVHQGAGLLDVVAQVPPQHRLEEMGGGVVPAMMRRRRAASTSRCAGSLTWTTPASTTPLVDDEVVGEPLGVGHPDAPAVAADNARVPHLAAGFAVEGGGRGDHLHLLAGLGLGVVPGLDDEGQDVAVAFQGVVAQEFGGRPLAASSW